MVDPNAESTNRERRIKALIGRTPSFIKSKFMSVLGSSNDLINGISNRLDISLSLSTSSDTETAEENPNRNGKLNSRFDDDESLDENIIDFDARKAKARRAHEEVISGKYRHPNLVGRLSNMDTNFIDLNQRSPASFTNSNYSISVPSTSPIIEVNCDEVGSKKCCKVISGNELNRIDQAGNFLKPETMSSGSTSENDVYNASISRESSDLKVWIRSESENSVPSWASSISLDSQTEEATLEFMKTFVNALFEDSSSISLDIKSEFGNLATTENGRLWFARLITAQRAKAKRVNESTFYSLVQYFAIVLFECSESEDYSPAKILMNMCFTYYHEVDVPGCEPYREYLYTYLREQPIWHSLRFWNAAFFDALQCERVNRPVPPILNCSTDGQCCRSPTKTNEVNSTVGDDKSSISSFIDEADNKIKVLQEDQKFQQNISFGQLGTFTCNMHAFGLSRDLCAEFLRKQCVIANLTKDQEKMLKDNISRMYKETAKWRT